MLLACRRECHACIKLSTPLASPSGRLAPSYLTRLSPDATWSKKQACDRIEPSAAHLGTLYTLHTMSYAPVAPEITVLLLGDAEVGKSTFLS